MPCPPVAHWPRAAVWEPGQYVRDLPVPRATSGSIPHEELWPARPHGAVPAAPWTQESLAPSLECWRVPAALPAALLSPKLPAALSVPSSPPPCFQRAQSCPSPQGTPRRGSRRGEHTQCPQRLAGPPGGRPFQGHLQVREAWGEAWASPPARRSPPGSPRAGRPGGQGANAPHSDGPRRLRDGPVPSARSSRSSTSRMRTGCPPCRPSSRRPGRWAGRTAERAAWDLGSRARALPWAVVGGRGTSSPGTV